MYETHSFSIMLLLISLFRSFFLQHFGIVIFWNKLNERWQICHFCVVGYLWKTRMHSFLNFFKVSQCTDLSLLAFSIRITVVSFDPMIDKITVFHSSRTAVDVTQRSALNGRSDNTTAVSTVRFISNHTLPLKAPSHSAILSEWNRQLCQCFTSSLITHSL